MMRPPPRSTLFPSTPLSRSPAGPVVLCFPERAAGELIRAGTAPERQLEDLVRGVAQLEGSGEHTAELQSQPNIVCRLLLEKKSAQRGADSPGGVRGRGRAPA